jgi:hypothetical protein
MRPGGAMDMCAGQRDGDVRARSGRDCKGGASAQVSREEGGMAERSDLTPGKETEARTGIDRPRSKRADIEAFVSMARAVAPKAGPGGSGARGRLVFALDATMSRQPTWDAACELQAELFRAADEAGGLSVQLAYYRGQGEARASKWVEEAEALRRMMVRIECHGGLTQIGKILDHVEGEAAKAPVAALAFVGDAMEEDVDRLCDKAGRLAMKGTRAFMFLEGRDPAAERAFCEIARLTRGAMLPFDRSAPDELRALIGAVATYAAGGRAALEAAGTASARRLLADLGR